ncbi:uncharacterized protein LOC118194677 [Stegodyphus dumicola]|uniref:uncharacterized protein LOC118194677 n=1 Tax=Stegodyphus dumicola TaxID=202533 RepID=UPI0015ADA498|nr:uncharacterized protein LOC118194677 [Stegodyphus dumicola]
MEPKEVVMKELNQNLEILEKGLMSELIKISEHRKRILKGEFEKSEKFLKQPQLLKETDVISSAAFPVKLDSSAQEKLAEKRNVADKLEDELRNLRSSFDDKMESTERIKKELHRREGMLIKSVQQIEAFLRAVFYLKQDAETMYEKLENIAANADKELIALAEENANLSMRRNALEQLLRIFKPTKVCLEEILCDSSDYHSVKQLVNYYLVLEILQQDLLNEDEKCQLEETLLKEEREKLVELSKSHPLDIAAKETEIQKLQSATKNVRDQILKLQQQMEAAKIREEAKRFDTERWISKLYDTACQMRPPKPDEDISSVSSQLDRIYDFVSTSFQVLERLKMED